MRHRRRGAPGVRESERDRHAHVGIPQVRERRTVAEADERVDGRGRMDDDLDRVVAEAEQKVGLDQLESLVRQRGRVDRDLRAHVPGRVRERLVGRHVAELVTGAAAERAAGGGQHERVNRFGRAPLEALVGGRMLAVHGQQTAAAAPPSLRRQLSRRHQALLVREREVDTSLERPEGRRQPGETDHRVQDDVRPRALEQLRQVSADLCQRREPVDRPCPGRGRNELELRMRVDDLERLPSDRAGGAEKGDPFHRLSVRPRQRLGSPQTGQPQPKAHTR